MTSLLSQTALVVCVTIASAAHVYAQSAPHIAHEARFGGIFQSANGDSLHLEGIWAAQRRFKLLVTDSAGSPIALERMREIQGQVQTGARSTPLVLLEAEGYFEARIPSLTLPAAIDIELRATPNGAAETLTFRFPDYSVDTSGDGAEHPLEIPDSLTGILGALRSAQQELRSSADRIAELTEVEHKIRELILATAPHASSGPASTHRQAEAARVVAIRNVWLLHVAFDYGSPAQIRAAVNRLDAAVADVIDLYGGAR